MIGRILGIIVILIGIAGLILPVLPGIILIIAGALLLAGEDHARIRSLEPERFPDIVAPLYDRFAGQLLAPAHRVILDECPAGSHGLVLDIGSGPGTIALGIAEKSPDAELLGIDLSPKMVEIARKKGSLAGRRARFEVMDANALSLPDASASFIISSFALHHWKDPVRVLNEIHRCLRPGCEAWIYDGNGSATDTEIRSTVKRTGGIFPPVSLVRIILKLHGFTAEEYSGLITDTIARSAFKTASFETRPLMMRIRLVKE
jgi:ubiquinone/menaquinone biosynthesis C-methylase UbiE